MDSEYLMRMEDLLDLYEQPYDPLCPVVCFDEMPFQLLGEVLVPIPMRPGKTYRYDHHYKREGTCCILLAVEPLAGWRFAQVRNRRTKIDYAEFMQAMIAARYERVRRVRLVEDNLNTHSAGSFYQAFEPEIARDLKGRVEPHHTPKKASWLNMAELELSVLGRQCLNRRIADQKVLDQEVKAWVKARNEKAVKLNWGFTTNDARDKLKRHYESIKN